MKASFLGVKGRLSRELFFFFSLSFSFFPFLLSRKNLRSRDRGARLNRGVIRNRKKKKEETLKKCQIDRKRKTEKTEEERNVVELVVESWPRLNRRKKWIHWNED